MEQLSKKQLYIYTYIKSEIKERGFPPSVREICKSAGLRSTSSVHAHLETLERKGYIRRERSKNRSIEILEDNFYGVRRNYTDIPVVGKITAGEPILAMENIEESFPFPPGYFDDSDEYFMLRVRGDSMIEKGIHNNDFVVVRKRQSAKDGDIVAALIDDSATVKTFYKEDGCIRLQPENPAYSPIIAENVTILGIIVGLVRFYK